MFTDEFSYDGTIACHVDGFDVVARLVHDDDASPPWEQGDGNGEVSQWTRRGKMPGERVLCEDRGSRRYYNVAEAIERAKREGWDAPPYTGTRGERAARAVDADFERMRRWCAGDWHYVGVVLSVSRNGVVLDDHAASLWSIESDAVEYLTDVANELLADALDAARITLDRLFSPA